MTRSVLILMACLGALPAFAQDRPSTTNMSCAQARQVVLSRRAAVLGTGGYTFDRFVTSRASCEPTETTTRAFVPTRDDRACFIGYRCKEPSRDDWDEF
jgi:hypothetical protein